MLAKYHTVHTQHDANQHHAVHERTFHYTQVSTVCCVETLGYTLSTIIAFFLIQQKVEDGKFCETQQVKLSRVLASQGRNVVLSCVVSVESGAVVECKPDRSLTADFTGNCVHRTAASRDFFRNRVHHTIFNRDNRENHDREPCEPAILGNHNHLYRTRKSVP